MIGIVRRTRVTAAESEEHFERLKANGHVQTESEAKVVFIFRRRLCEFVEYLVLSLREDVGSTEPWSAILKSMEDDEGDVQYELLTMMRTLQEDDS